jgi:hypothetical protein
MKVILKRDWFDPEGNRHRHLKGAVIEVPESLRDALPKDAVVLDAKHVPVTTADINPLKGKPLSAVDAIRDTLDEEQKRLEELEKKSTPEAEPEATEAEQEKPTQGRKRNK